VLHFTKKIDLNAAPGGKRASPPGGRISSSTGEGKKIVLGLWRKVTRRGNEKKRNFTSMVGGGGPRGILGEKKRGNPIPALVEGRKRNYEKTRKKRGRRKEREEWESAFNPCDLGEKKKVAKTFLQKSLHNLERRRERSGTSFYAVSQAREVENRLLLFFGRAITIDFIRRAL